VLPAEKKCLLATHGVLAASSHILGCKHGGVRRRPQSLRSRSSEHNGGIEEIHGSGGNPQKKIEIVWILLVLQFDLVKHSIFMSGLGRIFLFDLSCGLILSSKYQGKLWVFDITGSYAFKYPSGGTLHRKP